MRLNGLKHWKGIAILIDLESFDDKTKNIIDILSNNQNPIFMSNIFGNGNVSKKNVEILKNNF
jgi:hypothetical protein